MKRKWTHIMVRVLPIAVAVAVIAERVASKSPVASGRDPALVAGPFASRMARCSAWRVDDP